MAFQLIGLVFAYFGLQIVLFALDHPITSSTFLYNALLGMLVLYGALRTAGVRFRVYQQLRSLGV